MNWRTSFGYVMLALLLMSSMALLALLLKKRQGPQISDIGIPFNSSWNATPAPDIPKPWQTLTPERIVDTRANEADTLRFLIGDQEQTFVLYFVDALDASWNHPERIREQAAWFGQTAETLIALGEEARDWTLSLLSSHPVRLHTQWEQVEQTVRYYALIDVELEPDAWTPLETLLVSAGYARVHGTVADAPERPVATTFLRQLQQASTLAREKKRGAWALQ